MPTTTNLHPHSSVLRQRARHLLDLATALERTLVTTLPDAAGEATWRTARAHLCEDLLERNLDQLHRAADDLRLSAYRFRQHADDLDLALRRVAA